ncbi:MAG: hypothetical protein ABIK08_12855 [Pseudomonadota bacterium]
MAILVQRCLKLFAGFPLTAKLTVKSKSSDFREGSIRDTAFLGILRAKTVAEAREISRDPWHLRTAVETGKVEVTA